MLSYWITNRIGSSGTDGIYGVLADFCPTLFSREINYLVNIVFRSSNNDIVMSYEHDGKEEIRALFGTKPGEPMTT